MWLLRRSFLTFCALSLAFGTHAVADEPDEELAEKAMKQLKEINKHALPVFARAAGKGEVKVQRGNRAKWNADTLVFLDVGGWASSSSVDLRDGDVFINVGPSSVKVGNVALEKGEYAAFAKRKLQKRTLDELKNK